MDTRLLHLLTRKPWEIEVEYPERLNCMYKFAQQPKITVNGLREYEVVALIESLMDSNRVYKTENEVYKEKLNNIASLASN